MIRSGRPTARSRLIMRTSPVLAPSSAMRLTTVKIAIATMTGPARLGAERVGDHGQEREVGRAVDDRSDEVERATDVPPHAHASAPTGVGVVGCSRRVPNRSRRTRSCASRRRSHARVSRSSSSRRWSSATARTWSSSSPSARSAGSLTSAAWAAASARLAPREDLGRDGGEVHRVEPEWHRRRAVRPVPGEERVARSAEVPRDPVAVPAAEREVERTEVGGDPLGAAQHVTAADRRGGEAGLGRVAEVLRRAERRRCDRSVDRRDLGERLHRDAGAPRETSDVGRHRCRDHHRESLPVAVPQHLGHAHGVRRRGPRRVGARRPRRRSCAG